MWRAATANGTFGAMARGGAPDPQRREKVATIRWSDISLDGEWTIPVEAREKGNAGRLTLPEAAISIIQALPRLAKSHVFAGRGSGWYSGFSKGKASLDRRIEASRREEGSPSLPGGSFTTCVERPVVDVSSGR